MIPMLIGTGLALFALGYVLYPLFREEISEGIRHADPRLPQSASSTAIEALREIEFDHATGKLSDTDYTQLKATYTQRALAVMRTTSSSPSPTAVICPACGPREEPNAVFCSECGRALSL